MMDRSHPTYLTVVSERRCIWEPAAAGFFFPAIRVYPELNLTLSTCGDLFFSQSLVDKALDGLGTVLEASRESGDVRIVGAPIPIDGCLFNCAIIVAAGTIVGVVPKTYLPNTCEYYERRWFASAFELTADEVMLLGATVPIGADLLFDVPQVTGLRFGVEICEDLWSMKPPSLDMAAAGATLILNPSAGTEQVGKADYRRELVRQQSARCLCAYAYAGAGPEESSTDVVYSGHCLIAENGRILAETDRFSFEQQAAAADVDIEFLVHERLRHNSFDQVRPAKKYRIVEAALPGMATREDEKARPVELLREVDPHPFVPDDPARRAEHCREIFAIQSTGLARRLRHIGCAAVTLGISGGLDSSLALLVTIEAFERCGLERSGIVAVSMPGFGSTDRTQINARKLCELLGVNLRVIPIHDAVLQHFKDIGHDQDVYDVTYENAQARERTQILMDLANKLGGIVVGTGDLSELALGWCTFNGDHMSMYSVNCGVPKTLVRYLIGWVAEEEYEGETSRILHDIIDTPITPELLPSTDDEKDSAQKTEEIVGPYELHDFFLFHFVRNQFRPRKILYLAEIAFRRRYERDAIAQWLRIFLKRFFSQQFKRSAMPDGPKVGSVALSPRGDWRMPSDMKPDWWLHDLDEYLEHTS